MQRTISRIRALQARVEAMARKLRADERGVSGLVTAIALTALMGFTGLAIDVVMWEVSQRSMQGAADQAALAAATAYRNNGETAALGASPTAQNAAYATAIQSGYPVASATGSVTVTPYNNGGTCTNNGCIQVTITQAQQRYFTGIFLSSDVNTSVSAVGTCNGCGNGSFTVSSTGGDPCVMALDASGAGVITASGNPTMSLTSCNLYNNSPNTSATILNGGAVIEGCTLTNACGSKAFLAQPDDPGTLNLPVVTSASPAPDPYANVVPPTPASPCISSFPANPVPSGTYCPGNIGGSCGSCGANVTFADNAVIIITGGLSLKGNSTLSGTGVMLYVVGGASSIDANSTMAISAPTTGPYAGLAVWFGDSSSVTWNGGNSASFKGAIYAPTANVNYKGNAASASTCTRLIAAAITLSGTVTASFDNSGCPSVTGPVLTQSGVTGGTQYTGSPMLVQ
jgi:Flp pilus assembly protein TadG